jgi:hypothetical protein
MSTFLTFDCDLTGHKSIIDLCENGTVAAYPIKSFEEADALFWQIYYGKIPMPSVLVVDTVTKLIEFTKQDVVLDPSKKGERTLVQLGEELVTSKREYGIIGDKIIRFLRNVIELPCPVVLVFHEATSEDLMSNTEKKTLSAQAMVKNSVIAGADAIVRLTTSALPITENGILYPAGSRQLLLAPTVDSAVGIRTHLKLPPYLMNPTLGSFVEAIGGWKYFPHFMVLYGPPKLGKTTFIHGAVR